MSEQFKQTDGAATKAIRLENIQLSVNYQLQLLERSDVDHRSVYAIMREGDHIGSFQLHALDEQNIGFHIGLEQSQQRHGYGTQVYALLGEYMAQHNITLHTRCIDPQAVAFWEHLADEGLAMGQINEEGIVTSYSYPGIGTLEELPPLTYRENIPTFIDEDVLDFVNL